MNTFSRRLRLAAAGAACAAAVVLAGCGGNDDEPALAGRTLYAMTNGAAGNEVVAFRRNEDGTLTGIAAYATGGNGIGATEIAPTTPQDGVDVLASQGALALTPNKRILLAVNVASATVTSFRIAGDGTLVMADVKPSGGRQPNTVAARDDLVYVANVGDAANAYASNISGLRLDGNGTMTPIAGSVRTLSTANAQPASIVFNPAGNFVAVSELTTRSISVFPVAADGMLGTRVVNASAGPGPFGSRFLPTSGRLVVTEAMSSSLSSYNLAGNGTLTAISAAVPNGQGAACWALPTPDERTIYTSNTGNSTVSSYRVGNDGSLTLLQGVASTLQGPTSGSVDGGVSEDGRFLYVMTSAPGAITAHRIASDGSLTPIQTVTGNGLPTRGVEGMVVR